MTRVSFAAVVKARRFITRCARRTTSSPPAMPSAFLNLYGPQTSSAPAVIGHRGASGEAPELTIAALKLAQAAGCKVFQVDIQRTKDGVPVVFHDKSLLRVTGVDQNIGDTLAADLPPYLDTISGPFSSQVSTSNFGLTGRKIPLLMEYLQAMERDTHLMLEIKMLSPELIRKVAALIVELGLQDRVVWGNPFLPAINSLCRATLTDLPVILSLPEIYKLYALWIFGFLPVFGLASNSIVVNLPFFNNQILDFLWRNPKPFDAGAGIMIGAMDQRLLVLFVKYVMPRPRLFDWLRRQGVPVVGFILNTPEDWDRAIKAGMTGIQTDFPTQALKYLQEHHA